MTRLTLVLSDQIKQALRELADLEYREPQAQAALIIRLELERRGLLMTQPEESTQDVQDVQQDEN